jgi:hypothetical protein
MHDDPASSPTTRLTTTNRKQLALFLPRNEHEFTAPPRDEKLRDRPPTRLSWMKLLARVFRIDISVCSAGEAHPEAIRTQTHTNRRMRPMDHDRTRGLRRDVIPG